ncbi:MAG: Gx transporter family protein, partial [Lachnospiraceae bacterium]|nr:Gx transporter family protein [Lachnospiraceae bacterium]
MKPSTASSNKDHQASASGSAAGPDRSADSSSAARRVATAGLLASLALILSYVEALVPFNAGVPGVKLGLANLVPLIVLYRLDARYAAAVNLIRVALAGLLFTGAFAALYSLAGCIVSFLVMWICKKTGLFSEVAVSVAGGVLHNVGQIAMACILLETDVIRYYLPFLVLSGTLAGIVIGVLAGILVKRIRV